MKVSSSVAIVVAVRVGVGKDDDLAVAEPAQVEVVSSPQPRAVTRSASSLFSSTFASEALSVFSTFPAQRQNCLTCPIAPLLGRPAGESPSTMKSSLPSLVELVQSLSLAGKIQARGGCALARHFGLRRAARLAAPAPRG